MKHKNFKTCLVTGGCGFIGANLVRKLSTQIFKVRVVDNLSTGRYENISGCDIEFMKGDIRDNDLLENVLQGIDVVIHLAANPGVISSINDPKIDFEINAIATFNLLNLARKHKVQKFIFASSGGAVLGEQMPPVHEDMVPKPLSPYGASKLSAEAYCLAFNASYGLKTIILRFSNIYGPYSDNKSSVVAQFMKDILSGRELTVYGDGKQTRDFLFVDDLVSGIISAIDFTGSGEIFQIASGKETSILELVKVIEKKCNKSNLKVQFRSAREIEVRRNFSKIDKALNMLNFKPSINLENGLIKTWNWFKLENENCFVLKAQKC